MKRNKYGLIMLALIALTTGFTSCLNDEMIEDQKYGMINLNANKIIEIPASSTHIKNVISLDEGIKIYTYEVRLAAEQPASEDIVVNMEVISDAAAVIKAVRQRLADQYPATGEDSIPDEDINIFPSEGISVPASVTIPKGQRSVELEVSIDTHRLVGDAQFILVSIKSVQNSGYLISGNYGDILMNMKVKSIYDGTYICNGYRIRPGNPTEPVVDEERHLSTINATTVQDPKFGNYSGYQVNVEVTNEPIIVGGVTCYKVNATPVDEFGVAVGGMYDIFTGDPLASPAAPANPTEINYYNPVTKTFVLNCYYVSSINRIMYEVLVLK